MNPYLLFILLFLTAERLLAFAVQSGLAQEWISSMKKLSLHNLANLTPHPVNVFLNYSHPPALERIKRLRGVRFKKLNFIVDG